MTKNKVKKKRIRRADRFLRAKNKSEVLYRVPVFLKKSAGMTFLSESGTLETNGKFSRAYLLDDKKLEKLKEEIQFLQEDCAFVFHKSHPAGMLIFEETASGGDITEKFSEIENILQIKSMTADSRMAYYGRFLSDFLGIKTEVENYILDTDCWKQAACMDGIKLSNNKIFTTRGRYCVMAVRTIKRKITWTDLSGLMDNPLIQSMYITVSGVTGQQIKEKICNEYMGIDGMASRIKRNEPELYDILQKDESENESLSKYRWVSVYFLIRMESEQADTNLFNIIKGAYKSGIKMECLALAEQKNISELKRTFAMFGMTGNKQERYQMLITQEQVRRLLNIVPKEKKQENYDIEAMKALFYDGVSV
ncbi:hypothetical protein DXA60_01190 [Roseburia sp. OF03-24]|mgnify:CR=1 FL=1|uniref:hypothetical protein n=1 Tax=Roseburia sp. OF03-24 TaxID=2292367 RepID=UPI000E4DA002|nr:hypothetical protein [Roseburia sp. OF03-24]RGX94933.1 hypothetical protein DXA60_01190 [Roseburia sp. OF03-24]